MTALAIFYGFIAFIEQILFNDNVEVQQNLNYPPLTIVSHLTPVRFCFRFADIRPIQDHVI